MTECRLCRIKIEEGDRCEDQDACAKRVKRNARKSVSTMVTGKYVGGFDPDKAYRDAMGKP